MTPTPCCGTPLVALTVACEESSCTHACPVCGRHWAPEEWTDDVVRLS